VAKPIRYPAGVSSHPPRAVLNTYPDVNTQFQTVKYEPFLPYRAGDYTVTQTGGTATAVAWNTGGVVLNAGASASDFVYLVGSQAYQIIPGNQLWFNERVALRTPAGTYAFYAGLFDNVNPASATNGIYFLKPTGGSTLNFVILKSGTATTFQNIGNLAQPSGLTTTQDPYATTGVLATAGSGGNYTSISVTTPGAGYAYAPLVLATGATGANAQLYCQLGSAVTTNFNSFAQATLPTSTGLPYGALVAPYITAPGNASYTTFTNEVDPIIDLQFYWDGKGRILVGINGRQVMAIGTDPADASAATSLGGLYAITPGSTYNLATSGVGPNFAPTATTLSTSIAPFQPTAGSFYVMSPQIPMYWASGITNTAATASNAYIFEYDMALEIN